MTIFPAVRDGVGIEGGVEGAAGVDARDVVAGRAAEGGEAACDEDFSVGLDGEAADFTGVAGEFEIEGEIGTRSSGICAFGGWDWIAGCRFGKLKAPSLPRGKARVTFSRRRSSRPRRRQ